MIKGNLQSFVSYGQVGAEVEKEKMVINAPRGEFDAKEKEILMDMGFNIIAAGNATANIIRGMIRAHLDKLKDGTWLFFTLDKSTVETFPTFEELEKYIAKQWRSKLPARGIDRTYRYVPPTPAPAPPEPVAPVIPPAPTNVQEPTMTGNTPKRLQGPWETLFKKYGYEWDESEKQYINQQRGVKIEIYPNNSVQVYYPGGGMKQYPNLGVVLRKMAHAKNKRHPKEPEAAPAGEPRAQVTEENFKDLYRFLYT